MLHITRVKMIADTHVEIEFREMLKGTTIPKDSSTVIYFRRMPVATWNSIIALNVGVPNQEILVEETIL